MVPILFKQFQKLFDKLCFRTIPTVMRAILRIVLLSWKTSIVIANKNQAIKFKSVAHRKIRASGAPNCVNEILAINLLTLLTIRGSRNNP